MLHRREFNKIKACPRCGLSYVEGAEKCNDCGLIFSRLEIATNKDAKRKILRRDRDFIIKVSKLPSDVSYLRLLLYAIFLGAFGGHCFYVGRFARGSILLGNFIFMLLLVIFNTPISQVNDGALLGVLSSLCGFVLLMWFYDILMIFLKKFKVPVAIDLTSEGDGEQFLEEAKNELDLLQKDKPDNEVDNKALQNEQISYTSKDDNNKNDDTGEDK